MAGCRGAEGRSAVTGRGALVCALWLSRPHFRQNLEPGLRAVPHFGQNFLDIAGGFADPLAGDDEAVPLTMPGEGGAHRASASDGVRYGGSGSGWDGRGSSVPRGGAAPVAAAACTGAAHSPQNRTPGSSREPHSPQNTVLPVSMFALHRMHRASAP